MPACHSCIVAGYLTEEQKLYPGEDFSPGIAMWHQRCQGECSCGCSKKGFLLYLRALRHNLFRDLHVR